MSTENEKEMKREAARKYQEKKDICKVSINAWLDANPGIVEPKVEQDMRYLAGTGVRSPRSSVLNELREMFLEKKILSSMDVFKAFEFGRPTMEQKIKGFIKNGQPSARIWVEFVDGSYHLRGIGEDAPKGWKGFIPVVEEEL